MDWSLLGFQGLKQIFNVHPVFVHFPITLFPTAFFFYLLGIVRKRNDLLLGGQITLGLGLISTLVTVLTGYFAEESFQHGKTIHWMMETHETLGFIILGLGSLLVIWSFLKRGGTPKAAKFFLLLFGFTTFLILQNADLGGRMVFIEGAAVRAVLPASTHPHHEEANEVDSDHHHGDDDHKSHHH